MTDLLFALPADRPNELETARKRLAAAQAEFESVDIATSHGLTSFRGEYIKAWLELCNARACVGLIERQVIGEMR